MKKGLWKLLLALGAAPFGAVLVSGIFKAVTGFLGEKGMEAFVSWVVLTSFLYWPAYAVGLVLIVLSVCKLIAGREENSKSE